jgi:hypothetical protein
MAEIQFLAAAIVYRMTDHKRNENREKQSNRSLKREKHPPKK